MFLYLKHRREKHHDEPFESRRRNYSVAFVSRNQVALSYTCAYIHMHEKQSAVLEIQFDSNGIFLISSPSRDSKKKTLKGPVHGEYKRKI